VALGIAIPWSGPVTHPGRPRPEEPAAEEAPVAAAELVVPADPVAARAFVEGLFARHHGEIYAFLLRMLRDPELAADLSQDAFIRAYRACGTLDDPTKARAWLYQIAHRVALDEIRRRRIIRFVPWSGEARGSAPSPERLAMDARLSGDLERALARIPERQRAALLLAELHDLTGMELAAAMGTSHVAARALLTRARESLRRALAEERATGRETPPAARGERREADR
jgi:RNA polymerase sigma-70 factor, ECF subfamily